MKINKQDILSFVDKLTRVQKILLLVLVPVATLGLSWFFYLGPAWENITRLQQEVDSLEQDIASYSIKGARLSEVEKEFEERQKELVLARTLLPEDAHALERLLASFERLGNEKGVRFLLFQPGAEEIHKHYASRSVQLRLQGSFHNLMSYFDELSRFDRLVSLQSLRLNPISGQQGERIVLMAEAVLLVYRSLSQEELEAGKK